jgi:DinB superfamily
MTPQTSPDQLQKIALQFLEETFGTHHGIYLDKGTSFLETLDGVTAEAASERATAGTASIAAHVKHVVFYMDVLERAIRGDEVGKVNWREIWENDQPVSRDAWIAQVAALRAEYAKVLRMLSDAAMWEREDALGEFMAIAVHSAYHLGAIRQALAVIRERASRPLSA